MNKILLIGKFDSIFQGLNTSLGKYFSIQVAMDNNSIIKGILSLGTPDLIIFSLSGVVPDNGNKILSDIRIAYKTVPVLCIGSPSELLEYEEITADSELFHCLQRPVKHDFLVGTICTILNLEWDPVNDKVISKTHSSRKRILLVDDNLLQLRNMSNMLSGENYEITLSTSGAKALVSIGEQVPDLIFLDYDMPGCDGAQTLSMIRALPETKDVPVVFLTGVSDMDNIKAVLKLKPSGYLLKPASQARITELIYSLLEK